MQQRYDLHVHSSNSDGLQSPDQVLAGAGHLAGLAFTDHSSISFDGDLARAARTRGVKLLFPGIEISTTHDGCKYHVLGYGHGLLDPQFLDYAYHPTRIKNEVYAAVVDELRGDGYGLPSFDDMLVGRGLGTEPLHPTKWMMSKSVISRYLVLDGVSDTAARLLLAERYERHKSRHPNRYLPTRDVVARIRAHGGLPGIAHPWWECPAGRNTPDGVADALRLLRDAGLLGLEVSTRHHTVGTEDSRRQVASALGLLPLAGSDYHANGKTELGQFGLTGPEMDHLLQVAADLDLTL